MHPLQDAAATGERGARGSIAGPPAHPREGEGRTAVDCEELRRRISDADLRPRDPAVGAHLYDCEGCRDFVKTIAVRETGLAALSPPLSPWAAVAVLESVLERRASQ